MLAIIRCVVLGIASMTANDSKRVVRVRLQVRRLVRAPPVVSVRTPAVGRLATVRAVVIFNQEKNVIS